MKTQYLSPADSGPELAVMSVFKGQRSHLLCVVRPTFEKSKLPIIPFKGGVNMSGQAPPEVTNRHWVSVQDVIVAYPPEPLLLKIQRVFFSNCSLSKKKNSAWILATLP